MNNSEQKLLSKISSIKKEKTITYVATNPPKLSNDFIDEVETLGFKLILQAGVTGDDYLYVTNIPNYKLGVFECVIR